jgi:sirohydrochlorin ferrochelatase
MTTDSGAGQRPILLAVAHGSRDPAAQRRIRALARQTAELAPGIEVRAAFLENAAPGLAGSLARAVADAGRSRVAIVPLLLAPGYHLSEDIGQAADRAGVPAAAPLGPDVALVPVLAGRLAAARVPAGTPVVLAAAGSRDPRAAEDTRLQASLLSIRLRAPVMAGYVSAARPTVAEAVDALSAAADGPVAVATYLLAPGLFHDQLLASAAAWVSEPLGDHPAIAALVLSRFRTCQTAAAMPA